MFCPGGGDRAVPCRSTVPHPTRDCSPARGRARDLRALILLAAAAAVAGIGANFGIVRDYGYLRASILTGSAGGSYHAIGMRRAADEMAAGDRYRRSPRSLI